MQDLEQDLHGERLSLHGRRQNIRIKFGKDTLEVLSDCLLAWYRRRGMQEYKYGT